MKGLKFAALTLVLSTTSIAHSNTQNNYFCGHRLAIQGALVTGGALSIGLVDYTQYTELGLAVSGTVNNASSSTNNITPVLFAGFRNALGDQTYFAWGVNMANTFGTQNGGHIDADYQIGPYISIEQMLTYHVMLAGWIQPYEYEYQKISGTSVSTHNFFSAGGLAINYLF